MNLLFAFVFASFFNGSNADTTVISSDTTVRGSDTVINNYIGKFLLSNVVEVYTGRDTYNFKLHPFKMSKASNDMLESKNSLYSGIYVQYKWLSFDYSTSISNQKNDPLHDIKASNISTAYITDKWGITGSFHKYTGFVLRTLNKKNKTVLPQLKYSCISANAYFNLSANKFSIQAAYTYGKEQLKSVGGLSLWLQTDNQRWNIIPKIVSRSIHVKERAEEKVTSIYDVIPQIGYGYNWVINKKGFVASAVAHAGAGYSYVQQKVNTSIANWQVGWHAQLGYNGPKWYAYVCHDGSYQNYFTSNFLFNQQISNTITVGHRF